MIPHDIVSYKMQGLVYITDQGKSQSIRKLITKWIKYRKEPMKLGTVSHPTVCWLWGLLSSKWCALGLFDGRAACSAYQVTTMAEPEQRCLCADNDPATSIHCCRLLWSPPRRFMAVAASGMPYRQREPWAWSPPTWRGPRRGCRVVTRGCAQWHFSRDCFILFRPV